MKFKSALVTQTSGSVGGATFAHNQGGLYVRARSIPVNPATPQQTVVRNAVATLTNRWSATLTATQRTGWNTYSTNVPIVGSLGDARKVGALAMYVRSNVSRIQTSLAIVDAPPTTFTLGTFTLPTVSASAATQLVTITFTNTDDWATASGGAMLIYVSRPQSAGVTFFKGPYQYAGKIAGSGTPPTSPATFAVPFPVAAGQKLFVQVTVSRADGRLAAPFRANLTVAA